MSKKPNFKKRAAKSIMSDKPSVLESNIQDKEFRDGSMSKEELSDLLMKAAIYGAAGCTTLLLGLGADPNVRSSTGLNPLHNALRFQKGDVLRCSIVLLKAGTDSMHKDEQGYVPAHYLHSIPNGRFTARLIGLPGLLDSLSERTRSGSLPEDLMRFSEHLNGLPNTTSDLMRGLRSAHEEREYLREHTSDGFVEASRRQRI